MISVHPDEPSVQTRPSCAILPASEGSYGMGTNILDGSIVLDIVGGQILFSDLTLAPPIDFAKILWSPVDPNGLLAAPLGSICLSPVGLWENLDGAMTWGVVGGSASIATLCLVSAVPVIVDADNVDVTFTVTQLDGSPVTSSRRLQVFLYDVSGAGDESLSLNATWTVVSTGAAVSGLATNRLAAITDAAGVLVVRANNLLVETVYATAGSANLPSSGTPFVVAEADEATLVFT